MTSPFDKVWRATLSCLSRPADGDGVSPGEGWLHGLVDALDSHGQGVDRLEEQHVYVAHTFIGERGVRKKCAQWNIPED